VRFKILNRIFKINPDEKKVVRLMFTHSLFMGIAFVFMNTAANTMFLTKYSADKLPYMYVLFSIVVAIFGILYSALEKYLTFTKLVYTLLSFNFISLIALRFSFTLNENIFVIILYVFWNIMWVLMNLEFWALAGRIFNIRQGKRLYGFIGSGEMISIVFCGLFMPNIVAKTGILNLLFISAAALMLCYPVISQIIKANKSLLATKKQPGKVIKEKKLDKSENPLKNNYTQFILLFSALMIFFFYFIDNIFFKIAEQSFTDDIKLASFLGQFFATVGFLTLISKLFISDRIISRFGLKTGLMMLPLAVALLTTCFALINILSLPTVFILYSAIFLKLMETVVRTSINKSSLIILYQPLHAKLRLKTQMLVESVGDQFASGLTGLFLILLTQFFFFEPVHLSYIILAFVGIWIIVAFKLVGKYKISFKKALSSRSLTTNSILFDDRSSVVLLEKAIISSNPAQIIYALNLLEEISHPEFQQFLIKLIEHPSLKIREKVYQKVVELKIISFIPTIKNIISKNISPEFKGLALQTLATIGGSDVIGFVMPYLKAGFFDIRKGTMIGLLKSGDEKGFQIASEELAIYSKSESTEYREFAASILGELDNTQLSPLLFTLLKDHNDNVRKSALSAAAKLNNPVFIPFVVNDLHHDQLYHEVERILIALGKKSIPVLIDIFNIPENSVKVKSRVVYILSMIKDEQVTTLLISFLEIDDESLSTQAMAALTRRNYQIEQKSKGKIAALLEKEICKTIHLYHILGLLHSQDQFVKAPLVLLSTIQSIIYQMIDRLFYLLSYLYPSKTIISIRDTLRYGNSYSVACAYELLEIVISKKWFIMIIPLVEKVNNVERQKLLSKTFPDSNQSDINVLISLMQLATEWKNDWLKALLLYTTILNNDKKSFKLFTSQNKISSLITQEMIELGKLRFKMIEIKPSRSTQLNTIEKVELLKQTAMFKRISEEALAFVASKMKLVSIQQDHTIIKQNDMNDYMYIIATGKVEVIKDGRSLAMLRKFDIFGEFALIDVAPRSASVISLKDTTLLQLNRFDFNSLLLEQPKVLNGIIEVLCLRLRSVMKDAIQKKTDNISSVQIVQEDLMGDLLPLEKVLLLKQVNLFSEISDFILENISQIMEVVVFEESDNIIKKDEVEHSLYIIISGKVRVFDDEKQLAVLGRNSIVGELSLLDSEPRSANIACETAVKTLRLEQRDLFDMMRYETELGIGIISALVKRIRLFMER
jgi:CRP-like cAMP-binding protein/ATP/ADP translocase